MNIAKGATRSKILSLIKSEQATTVKDISDLLNISQVAVRQHVTILLDENLVEMEPIRSRPGRPQHKFKITAEGDEQFPRCYDRISLDLLNELQDWQGSEAVQTLFQRQSERTLQRLTAAAGDDGDVSNVLSLLAADLTERGFMAELCMSDRGTAELVYRNCAACSVAQLHPDICCAGHAHLLGRVVGDENVSHLTSRKSGAASCTVRVKLPSRS